MIKIMIVGEFRDSEAHYADRSFAGVMESMLLSLLKQCGIAREEVYITNAVEKRAPGNDFKNLCGSKYQAYEPEGRPIVAGKYLKAEHGPEIDRLWHGIDRIQPNVILAMGNLALWAVTKKTGIKKYRGSPLPTYRDDIKVIPTWSLMSVFRQWELRVIVMSDIAKVAAEKDFRAIRRPEHFIYMKPNLEDIENFYNSRLLKTPFVSLDIETKARSITEVGVGTADGKHCLVIPFWDRQVSTGNYWQHAWEEVQAWEWVRKICELPTVGQNFAYDMNYLWTTMGIPCPNFLGDTMLQHHSLQPELEKSLGFLGSIYTNEPSWKFMRTDHSTLKRGDD